jgi:NMD protein affecting ribosome stability and mRNA decay
MYCVNCGTLLDGTNQAGLVCQPCREAREKKRKRDEQPVSIRYCYRCGASYRPSDASIQHRFCSTATALVTRSNALLPERENISEVRKDTHVLLVFPTQETSLV